MSSRGVVKDGFDVVSISPGTQFMLDLHKAILEFLKKQKSSDPLWQKPKLIYSSCFSPGEGEHKIVNYIREQRESPDWNPNQVHCIYSNDADLIFLGLQTHEPYTVILREVDSVLFKQEAQVFEPTVRSVCWNADGFEIVHLNLVREYLSIEFGVTGEMLENVINDFIAIGFLIGNDFIPHFHDINIRKGTFDMILICYKSILQNGSSLLVRIDKTSCEYDKNVLKLILSNIVFHLREDYKEQNHLEGTDEEIAEMYTKANKEYLIGKFPDRKDDIDTLIEEMSHSLLDSFDWVLKYYSSGCPSWSWVYPFHYSPPLDLVLPFIDSHITEFDDDMPLPPLFMLLAIIPPQSVNLLPEPLRPLLNDPDLKPFYPETFEIDLNGQPNGYLATALLPFIDIDMLQEKFNEIEIPEEYSERNNIEFPLEIRNDGITEEINISTGSPFEPECKSNKLPPCVPSFKDFNYSVSDEIVPVHIFEFPSSKPTYVISVERVQKKAKDFIDLIGETVLINWPYLRPAKVIGLLDEKTKIDSKKNQIPRPENLHFPAEQCAKDYLTHYGLKLGSISVFLVVNVQNTDGSFSNSPSFTPCNLYLETSKRSDTLELFKPVEVNPPNVGDTLVFTGGIAENFTGTLSAIKSEKSYSVVVHQRLHPLIRNIIQEDHKGWVPMNQVLRDVGKISFRGLKYALTKVIIHPGDTNIAFALFDKRMVIEGCCRYDHNNNLYLIADRVVPLIKEYFQYTGNLKQLIMDSINKKQKFLPPFTLEDLYGGNQQHQEECFSKLVHWLMEHSPASKYPLVPSNSSFLSPQYLLKLESAVIQANLASSDKELDDYDPRYILWKSKPNTKITTEFPRIGQRVISVASSGPAPFGEFGTVVETNPDENLVIVLFDNELSYGSILEGRLNTNRGVRLSLKDLVILKV